MRGQDLVDTPQSFRLCSRLEPSGAIGRWSSLPIRMQSCAGMAAAVLNVWEKATARAAREAPLRGQDHKPVLFSLEVTA